MAAEKKTHRAVNVGLCAGLGVLAPLAAYTVTMPYEAVHEAVASGAAPFAVGAVAGVGALAVSLQVSEHRAERPTTNEFDGLDRTAEAPASSSSRSTRRRRRAKDDVPVIQRGPGAMSDEDAWAEITSLLDDDTAVSCDASRSKDPYEIAFDTLSHTGAVSAEGDVTDAVPQEDSLSTDAYVALVDDTPRKDPALNRKDVGASVYESTDVYLSLVEDHPAQRGGSTSSTGTSTVKAARSSAAAESTDVYLSIAGGRAADVHQKAPVTQPSVASAGAEDSFELSEDALCAAARDAALEALYGPEVVQASTASPVASVERGAPSEADITASMSAREQVWAEAVAILEEDEPVARDRTMTREQVWAEAAAILEDEDAYDEACARGARMTGRERFSVIQGGTQAMRYDWLTAEA